MPAFDHVFVIVMENHAYSQIMGSPSAPYINSLASSGALATNYHAVTHPSLPNYLALTAGSTFGITTDCTRCWVSATNIADRIESSGSTWKGYMEGMPSPCFVGDSYPYVQKHNPFIYFNNIRTNLARCQSHVVPYSRLSIDLQSTATTPGYGLITPDMCHDMHDCSVATGDSWLQQQVPAILSSPAFRTQHSLLALTWDEDDFSTSNHVPLILVGSGVQPGTTSSAAYNHYALLHTLEVARGLAPLTGNDAGAPLISDLFTTAVATCTGVSLAANPAATATTGTLVSFTAIASGCPNPLYQFWIQAPGSTTWMVAQAYSASATFIWSTVGLAASVYSLSVWARDANSSGAFGGNMGRYDAFAPGQAYSLTSTVSASCTAITQSASPISPSLAGTVVTLGASASGCSNPRYEFWILPPGGSWAITQVYSASATFTWRTAPPAGGYRYSIWVRDAASTASYDTYFPGTAYSLTTTPCTGVVASASPSSPRTPGTAVTITATASGCPNPRYQFWIQAPGGSWAIAQAYSSSASFTWNSTPPAGTYRYSVWVRDASSPAAYDTFFPGTAYTLTTTPCTGVTGSASPASPQRVGTTVTITANASGCTNPRYEFWMLAPGGSWAIVQPYSSAASFAWTTSGLPAGTYRYSVWVRDASSSAAYDTFVPGSGYSLN